MNGENPTSFMHAFKEAVDAVLNATSTVGDKRREHLRDANEAVTRALHDAHTGEQWYLAEHLQRSIKEVEVA